MNKKMELFFKEFSGLKSDVLHGKKDCFDSGINESIKKDYGDGFTYFVSFSNKMIVLFENKNNSIVFVYNQLKELIQKIEIKKETRYKTLKISLNKILSDIKKENKNIENLFFTNLKSEIYKHKYLKMNASIDELKISGLSFYMDIVKKNNTLNFDIFSLAINGSFEPLKNIINKYNKTHFKFELDIQSMNVSEIASKVVSLINGISSFSVIHRNALYAFDKLKCQKFADLEIVKNFDLTEKQESVTFILNKNNAFVNYDLKDNLLMITERGKVIFKSELMFGSIINRKDFLSHIEKFRSHYE